MISPKIVLLLHQSGKNNKPGCDKKFRDSKKAFSQINTSSGIVQRFDIRLLKQRLRRHFFAKDAYQSGTK
jgi:hypothetical protein